MRDLEILITNQDTSIKFSSKSEGWKTPRKKKRSSKQTRTYASMSLQRLKQHSQELDASLLDRVLEWKREVDTGPHP